MQLINMLKWVLFFTGMIVFANSCGNENQTSENAVSVKNDENKIERVSESEVESEAKEVLLTSDKTPKPEPNAPTLSKKTTDKEVFKKKKTSQPKKKKPRAKLVFDEPVFDYGFIMQGKKVEHEFTFRNIGDDDLLITRVKTSCGCTQPLYPTDPIKPGGKGKISVVFNSAGKLGRQVPTIDVYTNYKRKLTVKMQGYVDTERAQPTPKVEEADTTKVGDD